MSKRGGPNHQEVGSMKEVPQGLNPWLLLLLSARLHQEGGERQTLHRKLCRATVNSDRSDAVPHSSSRLPYSINSDTFFSSVLPFLSSNRYNPVNWLSYSVCVFHHWLIGYYRCVSVCVYMRWRNSASVSRRRRPDRL